MMTVGVPARMMQRSLACGKGLGFFLKWPFGAEPVAFSSSRGVTIYVVNQRVTRTGDE